MAPYAGDPNDQDAARFEKGMTGSCLCGSIKVTINKPDLFTQRNGHVCHCANCRKQSGCVASNNIVVARGDVEISDPERLAKTYQDANTGSGLTARRFFCSNCGSPVYSIPTDTDEQYVLPLGIFPRIPEPAFELFAAHRHPWLAKVDGATQYKFMTSSGEVGEV
ncbi:hypothetical protein LTR53_009947 [Teratosphaeriaceae sp. CCFEE 6253]|nr:hypothetical protein LTR53_009947 [Teratosphaeriaceae sp. CCFEE 6253]